MDTEQCQQAAQAFADSVEWWQPCQHCDIPGSGTAGVYAPCQPCAGTGKVLRYPHLFEAMYEKCACSDSGVACPFCHGVGYVVRPVMDIWWRLTTGAIKAEEYLWVLEVDTNGEAVLYEADWHKVCEVAEANPILATFAALAAAIRIRERRR